jgi:hypothetical protein
MSIIKRLNSFIDKERLNVLLLIIILSIVSNWSAFYNGFPMVTSDTGTYINSGFSGYVPIDRPIFYGLIIRHISLSTTLWLVVLFQGIIGVVTTYYATSLITKIKRKRLFLLTITVTILSFITSYSWYIGQIMPDIYTGFYILFFSVFISRNEKINIYEWLLFALNIFFIGTHNSNLLSLGAIAFILFISWVFYFRKKNIINNKRLLWLCASPFLSLLLILGINYSYDKEFYVSKGSHVFLIARLAENGILEAFLNDNCFEVNDYKLCDYKDKLPIFAFQYIWDPESPLAKTGGWETNKDEYNRLILETLKKPKYLKLHLIESVKATLKQYFQIEMGNGLWANDIGSSPYENIRIHFNEEIREYRQAKQIRNHIMPLEDSNTNFRILFFSTLLLICIAIIFWSPLLDSSFKLFFIVLNLGLIANAFVCGTFANVLDRLQSRCAWTMGVAAVFFIYSFITEKNYRKISL